MTMRPGSASPSRAPVRVVFATANFISFISAGRGAALALVELGGAAFFASGVAESILGPSAPWFVLGAVLLGCALRAVDLENCALFVPGGLYGTVKEAFGKPAAKVAASALLVDHLLLGALAASVAGHYVAALGRVLLGVPQIRGQVAAEDVSTLVAVSILGFVWWRLRQGRAGPR